MTNLFQPIIKIKTNNTLGIGTVGVTSPRAIEKVLLIVKERGTARKFSFEFFGNGEVLEGSFSINEPLLWSVAHPHLYDYTAKIVSGSETETLKGTFGFRKISVNGKNVCLNDTPIFIRGYIRGATAHDHSNNCGLSEEEFYRKNIRKAKKFGFNLVRFHSVVPCEEFFKVADEEGILVHIEMRLPDDIYNNLREMQTSGNVLVPDEYVESVVNALYHHPSLCVYCIGNEIKDASAAKRIGEIYALIRRLDDSRLFLDTCAWGANGREYVDIDVQHMSYYFPYGNHAGMYEDTENLLVVGGDESKPLVCNGENAETVRELRFSVPLIAHETCHYTALRDFQSLAGKFDRYGVKRPWWIDEELKMIRRKGYEEKYPEMYAASKRFQFACWKTAFEAMRSSKLLGGFHFLQFADTDVYENSNGIIDCFDDENAVSPKDFLKFNGDKVILTDLEGRNFSAGHTLEFKIKLSNLGEIEYKTADLGYFLEGENHTVYCRGGMKNLDVSENGLYDLCKVRIKLPAVKTSEKLTLKIRLACGEAVYTENEWDIWVYAKGKGCTYDEFVNYGDGEITITSDAVKAFALLGNGEKVCLIYRSDFTRHIVHKNMQYPEYAFKASWNRFKPVIWDRGTNYGGLLDCDPFNKYGFATDGYYDYNLSVLSEDCDKIDLDDFPVKVKNLISGIDKSCRDRFDAYKDCFNMPDLIYDRTLRNFSYLFEVAVERGKLLVCGLNFRGLDENEPSTVCMAEFIKSYMRSKDFDPSAKLTLEALKSYMKKCAEKPVRESIMTQFWEMDDAPVESKTFWRESKEYLKDEYAEENANETFDSGNRRVRTPQQSLCGNSDQISRTTENRRVGGSR